MSDFLLEFYSEEMPASFLEEASKNIKSLLKNRFLKESINFQNEYCYFTPRRITIIFSNLKLDQKKSKEVIKGPNLNSPDKAIIGFAKSFNTTKEKLFVEETDKGKYYFFKNYSKTNISDLLSSILESELKRITWKKSMKWGSYNLRWARPLKNILCLYNNKKIKFKLEHLISSDNTLRESLLKEKIYKVKSVGHYLRLMKNFDVMINPKEREKKVISQSKAILSKKKLIMHRDDRLMKEVCNLVEYPYLFLASFKVDYLRLPEEILITTMKKNQKYFPLYNKNNKLSNYFLLVSNINPADSGKMIIEGNERVVNARLEDAAFFWNRDKKNNFNNYFEKLDKVIYHNELGTIKDKVFRLKKLSEFVLENMQASEKEKDNFLTSVDLLKNDLVTEVVKEFPELQGVMGSYYAKISKYNSDVSKAIYDQYKPIGPSDKLPKTKIGKFVSLIDKIDSIVGFFIIGRQPTSSKDPFAIRRTALAIIRITVEGNLSYNLSNIISKSIDSYKNLSVFKALDNNFFDNTKSKILNFIMDRYENLLKDNKLYKDNSFRSLKTSLLKINLLEINNNLGLLLNFLSSSKGLKLLNAIKRVINILEAEKFSHKKDNTIVPNTKLFCMREEHDLYFKVSKYADKEKLEFKALLNELVLLIKPIENFFDNVQINHQNNQLKKNRLELLFYVSNKININVNFINLIKRN
ncbi:glycine--tRNA ligase subunit beta [Alphaproteobacteria bacterium]|nr:glycine--tRNA ligase subunit beta [Alphaproteobacteria bacterium]